MAFNNLFIRKQKSIGGIQLDGVILESHDSSFTLTRNPIELGADVTDHTIIEPKRISILAEVSDSPIGFAAVTQIVDTVTGLFGSSNEANITRSYAAFNALNELADTREPIEVQTKLKLYENMIITSIRARQDRETSRIARMEISLEEIRIVESEIVQLSAAQLSPGRTLQQASPSVSRGRQEAQAPSSNINRSVLKTITTLFG